MLAPRIADMKNDLDNKFKRADLEFHNVGHRTLSYEARVFFNAENVNHDSAPTPENPSMTMALEKYIEKANSKRK